MTILAFATQQSAFYRDSRAVATRITNASYPAQPPDHVEIFYKNLGQWKSEAAALSSVADKISLPSFLAIVALQEKAIPLIVNDLRNEPSFLFMALRAITRQNPVPKSSSGKPQEIVKAWISWAEDHGHVSD